MPIPKPKAGEKKLDFMARCMSDNTMVNEYGTDQRLAVCSTSYKEYKDFYTVCSRIRKEIREDQITGGMVGQYNPSITQRLNSLKEQIEQTNIEQPLFPDADTNDCDK
mgnify:CR=1 FL=1